MAANDEIFNEKSKRMYIAKEVLGKGTFGQVVHVVEQKSGREFAAKIRAKKKPEPYKGKGIKYVGEHIRRKA